MSVNGGGKKRVLRLSTFGSVIVVRDFFVKSYFPSFLCRTEGFFPEFKVGYHVLTGMAQPAAKAGGRKNVSPGRKRCIAEKQPSLFFPGHAARKKDIVSRILKNSSVSSYAMRSRKNFRPCRSMKKNEIFFSNHVHKPGTGPDAPARRSLRRRREDNVFSARQAQAPQK